MKQLDLFAAHKKTGESERWQLFIDGAARNNPGPAGAGVYVVKNGEPYLREGFFLGQKTNNQAEYTALLIGLLIIAEHMYSTDVVEIVSDSELLVRQIKGDYKVKDSELKRLHALALLFLQDMNYTIRHVLRSENPVADELANMGIDKQIKLPIVLAQKLGL